MKIELLIWNPETCEHEVTKVTEAELPRVEHLDEHYTVRGVYAYPALNQVRIFAQLRPE